MKKLITLTAAAALMLAVPAQADKPANAGGGKSKGAEKSKGKGGRCTPRKVGYNAKGLLVSQTLTQTKGADTPTDTSDDRYSGTVEVNVTKANHKGLKGVQTFTVTDVKVTYYDSNGDGVVEQPQVGDRVKVHGKITKLNKRCDSSGFTPTVTVKHVQFQAPPVPEPAG